MLWSPVCCVSRLLTEICDRKKQGRAPLEDATANIEAVRSPHRPIVECRVRGPDWSKSLPVAWESPLIKVNPIETGTTRRGNVSLASRPLSAGQKSVSAENSTRWLRAVYAPQPLLSSSVAEERRLGEN